MEATMQACAPAGSSSRELFSTAQLDPIRQRMICHPVFTAIHDVSSLRRFMEAHVFAVWDFMSLLKRLQRELTCVELPWMPRADTHAAQLINQIVLGEESDIGPDGKAASHLELYVEAMREVGASTTQFENFLRIVRSGSDLNRAFAKAGVPGFVRKFTGHTLAMALHAAPLEVMASFLYGRENVIPGMFNHLLESWGLDAHQAPTFVYYLNRHIELDGDSHGPAAETILEKAIGGDPKRRRLALDAARQSIEARVLFWDGVLDSLQAGQPSRGNSLRRAATRDQIQPA
jgi:hypothetical protein